MMQSDHSMSSMKGAQQIVPNLPTPDSDTRAFWTGGLNDALLITKCQDCALYIHPPAPVCRHCQSQSVLPEPVSGAALLFSFSVNFQQWDPCVPVPFVIAVVELVEQSGLRLTTQLVGLAEQEIQIGMPLQVVFEPHGEVALPHFTRRNPPASNST